MTQIKGIDVSHWQGNINWQKVKNDRVEFVFVKATEGTNYVDDKFKQNVIGAKSVGIKVGAYHYAKFSNISEAKAEVQFFLKNVSGFKFEYPVVLDLEENKKGAGKTALTDATIFFLEAIEKAGYHAMLYTGKSFLENTLSESRLTPYAKWIARYGVSSLGRNADIWQYSQEGKVNGIVGNVDMNWAYRDFSVETKTEKVVVPAPKTDTKTVVDKKPKPISITVNGQPRMAIFYKGATHIIWTVLRDLIPQKNTHLGDGLFNIAGRKVQGVVYEKNTYIPWGLIAPGKIKVERHDGKPVNFVYKA